MYTLRKAPKRELYWIYHNGKKMTFNPVPLKIAQENIKKILEMKNEEARKIRGGAGLYEGEDYNKMCIQYFGRRGLDENEEYRIFSPQEFIQFVQKTFPDDFERENLLNLDNSLRWTGSMLFYFCDYVNLKRYDNYRDGLVVGGYEIFDDGVKDTFFVKSQD